MTTVSVTKVRSASSRLVLHAHHIFANSFNFLVTWGLSVTIFHSSCIFCVDCMALYWPTLQFYLRVRIVCLPACGALWLVLCCNYFSLSSVVCMYSKFGHHPHPLGYHCAKFRFFHSLHCWGSHAEKLCTKSIDRSIDRSIDQPINQSINQSPSLFDALGTEACASEQSVSQFHTRYLILHCHRTQLPIIYILALCIAVSFPSSLAISHNSHILTTINSNNWAHLSHLCN